MLGVTPLLSMLLPLALLGAPAGGPTLERTPERWVLRNSRVRCELDLRRGGLPALIADGAGRPLARDAMLYTDNGLFEGAGMVSSVHCAAPQMTWEEIGGELRVTAAGTLLPAPGKSVARPLRYRVQYALRNEGVLRIRLEISTPTDRPDAHDFLALLLPMPGAQEWSARTLDGLAAERFGTARERVWQSAEESLDPDWPEVGVLWAGGRRLTATVRRVAGPLDNVFWYQGAPGQASLFVALLSGQRPTPWKAETPWVVEMALRVE